MTQERQHAVSVGARFGKFQCSSGGSGMKIKDNELTFTGGFPSATLAGVLLTRGKWYYEIKCLEESCAPQHGWADLDFIGGSRSGVGVGDDKHSWGYDGRRAPRQGLWADGPVEFGRQWKIGDICSAAADLESRRLSFALNGNWGAPMGVAAEGISYICGLIPAFTSQGGKVSVNLGESPFAHPVPAGHSSVHDWICGMRTLLSGSTTGDVAGPPQPPSLVRGISTVYQDCNPGVMIRVHSGHTHAILENADNIVGARDGYPSFVAHDLLLVRGHWAFEAEILCFDGGEKRTRAQRRQGTEQSKPGACVGWADKRFFGDYVRNIGVGDDTHSWGWHFSEDQSIHYKHGGISTQVEGEGIKAGDVLCLTIALHSGSARFFVNGKLRGCAEDITPAVGMVPSISVQKGLRIKVRLGPILMHGGATQATQSQKGEPMNAQPQGQEQQQPATDLQNHFLTFQDCRPVSDWAKVHGPQSKAGALLRLERATSAGLSQPRLLDRGISAGALQPVMLERACSAGLPPSPMVLKRASSDGPPSFEQRVPSLAQVPEASSATESAKLHMQQLQISARLVLSDCVGSGDEEMRRLMQAVLDAAQERLRGP